MMLINKLMLCSSMGPLNGTCETIWQSSYQIILVTKSGLLKYRYFQNFIIGFTILPWSTYVGILISKIFKSSICKTGWRPLLQVLFFFTIKLINFNIYFHDSHYIAICMEKIIELEYWNLFPSFQN